MILIWGSGGNRIKADNAGCHKCDNCNNNTDFSAVIDYRYFHLWYIISFITSRKYAVICDTCSHGYYLDKEEFKNNYEIPKIPLIHRTGKYVIILLVILFTWIHFSKSGASNNHDFLQNVYISEPKVNDIYITNLAKIKNSGYEQNKKSWGALKLVKYDAENKLYYFTISNIAYSSGKVLNKKIKELTYSDMNDVISLNAEEVSTLKEANIIYDVRRF